MEYYDYLVEKIKSNIEWQEEIVLKMNGRYDTKLMARKNKIKRIKNKLNEQIRDI